MSARPRGFITDWRPRAETVALLAQVQKVLDEYRDQLPLTLRQVFYRLVGAHGYEKTEQAYKRLTETMNKARRAKLVDMETIRDDGFVSHGRTLLRRHPRVFFDGGPLGSGVSTRSSTRPKAPARAVVRKRRDGPPLARVANPFGIEVYSGRGFDSVTEKHRLARLWAKSDPPMTVLYVGDYLFDNPKADITAFAATYGGDNLEFVRVAVTPDQALLSNLPTAPPKPTDNRRFEGDETWQAEALDPRTLAQILTEAIEQRFDRTLYDAVLEEEWKARQDVLSRLRNV